MPLVSFSFLDRVNFGFASVAGLQASLGLHGFQYNIGLTCFYTTYVVVETPNNLRGKHFGTGRWLAGCAFGFGICCMYSAFVRNFAEFCFSSKEGPGIAYFLSKIYRRQELTCRSAFPSSRPEKPSTYSPPRWVSSSLQSASAQPLAVLLHQESARLTSTH
ncbi:hypothetical protein DFH09DRAFT_1190880 [Mycena vulgaris]|nr:hypothetical protein DFH09DRAFT_1190880 [Mycena vulgaris]